MIFEAPAGELQLAPLGTFVVAREDAGIRRLVGDGLSDRRELPVYDEPGGEPRVLLDRNLIDGLELPRTLTNWSNDEGVLVMRVIAGTADDDWLIVQAPTRPHNQYVWVRASDFVFGHTDMRVEIDIAGEGSLTVLDAGTTVLQSSIVHGRESRETPVHVTYIERGVRGRALSPAYGTAILAMASFSEQLGTFGGGGLPANYLHGTNQPELMGQQVSSGEIRVPDEVLDQIIETIAPGTPVLLFDSSVDENNRQAILERTLSPAPTIGFDDGANGIADSISPIVPQLWQRCPEQTSELVCRRVESTEPRAVVEDRSSYPYLIAKEDAGEFDETIGATVVPVFDEPGGAPRMLLHTTAASEQQLRFPLRNPTHKGERLVLWPLEVSADEQWIRVHAPVRPQGQSVWVRASDFVFASTSIRIEVDIAADGGMTVFDDDEVLFQNPVVAGRESRPTVLGASYIDQIIDGATLSPAYGSYVMSYPIFSDVLPSFGGELLPNQSIHGTNQPELMGQRVSSGNIRLPNEIVTFLAEQPSILGARVIVYDSSVAGSSRAASLVRLDDARRFPAATTNPEDTTYAVGEPLF